jgi:hypothetical protein
MILHSTIRSRLDPSAAFSLALPPFGRRFLSHLMLIPKQPSCIPQVLLAEHFPPFDEPHFTEEYPLFYDPLSLLCITLAPLYASKIC